MKKSISSFAQSAVCALFCASVFVVATARADTISVNFIGGSSGSNQPDGPSVVGAAGAVSVGGWNNEAGASGSAIALGDSTGAGTTSLLNFQSNNIYGVTPGAGPAGDTGDPALMTGYLDNFTSNGGFVTISNLGTDFTSGGYDVLLYTNGDHSGSFGFTVTDSDGQTHFGYGLQTGPSGANYPLLGGVNGFIGSTSTDPAGPASDTNYILLTGFTGTSFTITGRIGTSGNTPVVLNGFQIVSAVPEPGSLMFLGLGVIGLTVIARRRLSA